MLTGKRLEYVLSDLSSPCMSYYDVLCQESELKTYHEIVEEYRDADRKKRNDMWFMFRELREKFDNIERVQHNNPDSET